MWKKALAVTVILASSFVASGHTSTPNTFKTWTQREVLSYSDLNNNFAHLHWTFSGNITDANINSAAAIQHSKLAQPTLIPKAVAVIGTSSTVCNGSTSAGCTMGLATTNVASVVGAGTDGVYLITLSYTPTSTMFPVLVTPVQGNTHCNARDMAVTSPHFKIYCYSSGATTNVSFSFLVF